MKNNTYNLIKFLAVSNIILVLSLWVPVTTTITKTDGITTAAAITHAQEVGDGNSDQYQFLAPIGGLGNSTTTASGTETRVLDVSSEQSFPDYIQTIITLFIGFAIMAAIVLIIASGFQYMTTVKEGKTSEAKEQIGRAIGGLILALAAVVILQTINPQLIEINSVEQVEVEGGDFSEVDYEFRTEFGGGSVHVPSENTHGSKYCMYILGEYEIADLVGFGSENNRYVCYSTEQQCEEGKAQAEEVGKEGGWFSELSCDYYFESEGELVYTETEVDEVLESGFTAVTSESKEAAKDNCETKGRNIATEKNVSEQYIYEQCIGDNNMSGSGFDDTKCEVRCTDPGDEPLRLPDIWDEGKACPIDTPYTPDDACRDNPEACETASGKECYLTPTKMFGGKPTSCEYCTFVSELPTADGENGGLRAQFKGEDLCSGDENNCRISIGLATKLEEFYKKSLDNDGPDRFDFEVTEAFPPTYEHQNECHYRGTCIDVGVRISQNDEDWEARAVYLDKFISAADESGLSACYEVKTQNEEDQIMQAANNLESDVSFSDQDILVIDNITADHFSVYQDPDVTCE